MRKNVLAKDLKIGDTVKMSHVENGVFMDMLVTEIDENGLTATRPYLIPSSDQATECSLSKKLTIRPHIGLEPVWFPLNSSMKFDVLSESDVFVLQKDVVQEDNNKEIDGIRFFKGEFVVSINENEGDDPPLELNKIKDFLKESVLIDIDFEEFGDPVGLESLEMNFDSLVEFSPKEVE